MNLVELVGTTTTSALQPSRYLRFVGLKITYVCSSFGELF